MANVARAGGVEAEDVVSAASSAVAGTAHIDTFAQNNLPPSELWPEFVFNRPELHYPPRLNCVTHFLDRWVAEGRGDMPCVISPLKGSSGIG